MVLGIDVVFLRTSRSMWLSNAALGKILADQLVRSLTMLADLDKRILVVLRLTGANLTEVSICLN